MICLGGSEYQNYYGIIKLLDVLFSTEIPLEEKKMILQTEFNIDMVKELGSEVQEMCNYGAGVVKRCIEQGLQQGMKEGIKEGVRKGIIQSITNLMSTMDLTLEQAMDALLIPESDRKELTDLL